MLNLTNLLFSITSPITIVCKVLSFDKVKKLILNFKSGFMTYCNFKVPINSRKMEFQSNSSDLCHLTSETLSNTLPLFKSQNKHLDLELKCEGKSIFCHKLVMSFSPLIYLCLKDIHEADSETVTVMLEGFNYQEVEVLVESMYASLPTDDSVDFKCSSQLAKELSLQLLLDKNTQDRSTKLPSQMIRHEEINYNHAISRDKELTLKVETSIETIENETVENKKSDEEYLENSFVNDDFEELLEKGNSDQMKFETNIVDNEKAAQEMMDKEKVEEEDFIAGKRAMIGLRKLKKYPKFEMMTKRELGFCLEVANKPRKKAIVRKRRRCFRCDFETLDQRVYKRHAKNAHPATGPVCCIKCHVKIDARNLDKHLQTCQSFKCCEDCGYVAQSSKHFHAHRQNHHKKVKCQICNESFPGKLALLSHKDLKHKTSIPCPTCGKLFARQQHLHNHIKRVRTKYEERTHKCQYCEKAFTESTKLKSHVASAHTKDKPFKCRFHCGKAFNDHGNRTKHEKIHKRKLALDKDEKEN